MGTTTTIAIAFGILSSIKTLKRRVSRWINVVSQKPTNVLLDS
jgi:hypothetical protein